MRAFSQIIFFLSVLLSSGIAAEPANKAYTQCDESDQKKTIYEACKKFRREINDGRFVQDEREASYTELALRRKLTTTADVDMPDDI